MRKLKQLSRTFLESKKSFLLDRPDFTTNLIVGKFRTFHLGHSMLIDPSRLNIICIVGTLDDDELNLRAQIIRNALSKQYHNCEIEIVNHPDGYVPSILYQTVREMPTMHVGEDRIQSYIDQCKPFDVNEEQFTMVPRMMSSTDIIQMLQADDINAVVNNCPGLNALALLTKAHAIYCS